MSTIGSVSGQSGMGIMDVSGKRPSMMERLDKDQSGALSSSEIDSLLGDISDKTGKTMTRDDFLAVLDKDGNGEINAEELKGIRDVLGPPPENVTGPGGPKGMGPPPDEDEMFSKVDADGSGAVSESELGTLLSDISEKSKTTLDAAEILEQLDTDGNGELSKDEMTKLRDILGKPPEGQGRFAMQNGIQMGDVANRYIEAGLLPNEAEDTALSEA